MADDNNKPKLIIFGGCGFIGRSLVEYLISNDLVSTVRVIDKVPPQIAWLNKQHQKLYDDPRVEYKSANLILSGSCENAFADGNFNYAVNCACETKPGQTDPVYKEGVYKVSINCATAAAKHGIKRFVEVSSGKMASNEKTPHKESDPVEPWTNIARFKLQVEEQLKNIPGLKYTIVRPAIVYGIGDRNGLAARLVLGGVYRHLGESMKLLWSRDLVMNTVHVHDLVRAIWYLAQKPQAEGQIYNIADDNHTTQGAVTDIISEIFNINHDYYGNILSNFRKNDLASVVDEVNDKHLGPWAEACQKNNIENTPLSPYIHQELLDKKHLNLNTDKLKATGFTLTVPTLNKQLLQEVLDDYVEMNLFPRSLMT